MGTTARGWAALTAAVVVPFSVGVVFAPGHGMGWPTPPTICASLNCSSQVQPPQGYGVLGAHYSSPAPPTCSWTDRLAVKMRWQMQQVGCP